MTVEYDADEIRAMTPQQRDAHAAELGRRLMRFAELQPNWGAYGESHLPGNQRALFHYVGTAASPIGAQLAPVPAGDNFSFAIVLAGPGQGAPLHAHTTEEVFLALSGRWGIYWGEPDTRQEVLLDRWDGISVPGPVMRGFRNAGTEDAYLLAVLGGGSPPPPIYHPTVVEQMGEPVHRP